MESTTALESLLGQADWLRALAISLLGSRPDADDAVQEVWTAALRSPPDQARPPRPWLAQVLRNVVRARARGAGRRRHYESEAAALAASAQAPGTDRVLERMQLHRRIAELVVGLPEPYRTTLLLRFYEGRAPVDLAREAGLPEGTVRWRINEGVRRLREQLDQDQGGRRRWAAVLAPLAGLRRPPVVARVPLWLGAAVVAGAAGALWLAGAHLGVGVSPGGGGDRAQAFFHHDSTGNTGQPQPGTEDPIMKRERLKRTALLFGVVLPALGAGAAEDDRKLEELAINACVELNEKSYECRDEFVDAFLDLRLQHAGKKATPEERAKMREKAMRELVERGSGSMERKRAVCRQLISQMGNRALEGVKARHPDLQSCYTRSECKERVACMMPIIGAIHGDELKQAPKTGR